VYQAIDDCLGIATNKAGSAGENPLQSLHARMLPNVNIDELLRQELRFSFWKNPACSYT
jgi:hypothetical protein